MAVTNRLANTRLTNGQESAATAITPPGDGLTLRLTTVQIGTPASQASLHVKDSQGRNLGKVVCQDGEDKRLSLEGFPAGVLTFQVECNLGTVDALVEELTGNDATFPSSPGGQSATADLEDGSVTAAKLDTDAVTTVKILDANVTTVKILDNNVTEAKMADGAKGLGTDNLQLIADPTDAGTIAPPAAGSFQCDVTTLGASETRVLGAPAYIGQVCVIRHAVDGGDFTMTNASGWNGGTTTDDVATFAEVEDVMVCVACGTDAVDWREIANVGVVIA